MKRIPPVHIHSYHSFYNSTLPLEEIFDFSKKEKLPFISLTDDNLSIVPKFYKICLEEKIKPIIGLCFSCKFYAIAKNYEGLKALYRISSKISFGIDEFDALKDEKDLPLWFFVSDEEPLKKILKLFPEDEIWLEIDPLDKNYEILRYNLPFIYGKPVKIKDKEENKLKILQAIKNLSTTGKIDKIKKFQKISNFYIEDEYFKKFYEKIEEIEIKIPLNEPKLPLYPFLKNEEKKPFLLKILKENFEKKYKNDKKAREKLEYEIKTVEEMGFIDYFLIVWDIVENAKKKGFYTLGRGSAASSILCYLLDITPVDPIKENLYFERFLNPYRTSPPDIDLDFGTSRRDEILDYIYKTYKEENVGMISTHICYSLRGALRDVGKAKGYSEEEITKITKFLPHYENLKLKELIKKYPECKNLPFKDPKFNEIYDLSLSLLKFPRGFGIHCGGVVISPSPLTDFLSLTKSANGRIITQPDMYGVEDLGLLKMDILGNRSLDVLPSVLSKIEEPLPELEEILKDEGTKEMIKKGETIGCFYIESPAMRGLLQKLKVEDFQSMVIATSIIRPGVAESGMMQAYIRRYLGKEEPVYPVPEMEELLKETLGVMVYQEDVIRVANKIGGLTLQEADSFRKAMSGKSRSKEEMEKPLKLFIEKALKKGYPRSKVEEISRQISSFAGYAFCKAHSAAFSCLSFKMAYLKKNFPEIFLSSVLNCGGGFYPPIVYVSEAKRLGIEVLPPSINLAEEDYKAERGKIITGFKAVKNLSGKTIEKILKERNTRKFSSFLDFTSRVCPEKEEIENLIKAGAFDSLGYKRKETFYLLNFTIKGEVLPFLPEEMEKEFKSKMPEIIEKKEEKMFMEWETLGFPLSSHPVEFVRNGSKIYSKDLKNYKNKKISIPGLILVSKKIWIEKQRGWMKFLSLEDEMGFFEAVIFPKNYQKYAIFTKKMGPHLFEGIVKEDSGTYILEIENIFPLKYSKTLN